MLTLRRLMAMAVICGAAWSSLPSAAVSADEDDGAPLVEDAACPLATPTWGRDVWFRLRRYWNPDKMVQSKKRGAADLRFYVDRQGRVLDVITLRTKGGHSLEEEARSTILRAGPFAPPPYLDAPCERLGIHIRFFYNMGEEARDKWLAEAADEAKK